MIRLGARGSLRASTTAAVALVAALSGEAVRASATPADPIELRVEAPAALTGPAERVRSLPQRRLAAVARLVGLETSGPAIRVVLAEESDEAAERAPAWVSGYAYGALGVVVLLPERGPSYPDSSLEELLRHEIAHVLLHRAAGGRPVPRWFNEGVAMTASGGWGIEDRSRLTLALVFQDRMPVARLDERFGGGRGEVARAYALSGALVREMLRRFGRYVVADLLDRVAVGVPFDEAFRRTTGLSLAHYEDQFWRRYSIWYRWLPILTSSTTVWVGIAMLALWASRKRRRRRAELERRWEEEDRWQARVESDDDGRVN